ncbi:MAG: hypothetical protein ACE5FQ_00935 [Thiogranum sp.]
MSMSINGSMNPQMFRTPDHGGKDFSPLREKVNDVFQNTGKQAPGLQKIQHNLSAASRESSPEKLQAMAERLENRTEAVTTRFNEMSTRLNERFDSLEARALENGKEGQAERIGEISDRVNNRLDNALEKTVARLDEMSERVRTMLSESYEDIGDSASTSEEAVVSEVA